MYWTARVDRANVHFGSLPGGVSGRSFYPSFAETSSSFSTTPRSGLEDVVDSSQSQRSRTLLRSRSGTFNCPPGSTNVFQTQLDKDEHQHHQSVNINQPDFEVTGPHFSSTSGNDQSHSKSKNADLSTYQNNPNNVTSRNYDAQIAKQLGPGVESGETAM